MRTIELDLDYAILTRLYNSSEHAQLPDRTLVLAWPDEGGQSASVGLVCAEVAA